MDPVSIVGLVSSCSAIGQKLAIKLVDLHDLRGKFQTVGDSITMLSSQVTLTNPTLSQLRGWPEKSAKLSDGLRSGLSASLEAYNLVTKGIQDHVSRVKLDGSGSIGFRRKIRHLWDEKTV
jgi:hypothetical protein